MIIKCETCGRELGAELIHCPDRLKGKCPYRLTQKETLIGQEKSGFGEILLSIGLAAVVAGIFFKFGGLFTVIIGFFLTVVGMLMSFGGEDILYDKKTGQFWLRRHLGRFELHQVKVSTLKPIRPDIKFIPSMDYPASLLALYQHSDQRRSKKQWTEYAADIFYMTLLSLLGQGIIEIRYATINRSYLGRSPKTSPIFALNLIDTDDLPQINGELEKQIIQKIKEWQPRTDIFIKTGRLERLQDTPHCFLVNDLVFLMMAGEHKNPGKWFVVNVVGKDAAQRGFGTIKGSVMKNFELNSTVQNDLKEAYYTFHTTSEGFITPYQEQMTRLRENIVKTIEMCIDTG